MTCNCEQFYYSNERTERTRDSSCSVYTRGRIILTSPTLWSLNMSWNCKLWTSLFAFSLLLASTTTALRDVEYGKQLKMSCFNNAKDKSASSRKLIWLKDGKRVKYSGRVIQKRNFSVLKIKNAMPDDIGIYACMDVTRGEPGTELAAYNVSLIPGGKRAVLLRIFVVVGFVFTEKLAIS